MSDSGKKRVKCGILGAFWGSFPRFFEVCCLSFEANWKIVLLQTKNHSHEIEKSKCSKTAFLGAYNRIFTSFFRYLHELHSPKYKSMMLLLFLFLVSRRKCCRPVLRSLWVRMSPEDGAGFLFVRGATVRGWRIFLWLSRRGKIFDSGAVLKIVL